jgi:hypothetical protein
MTISAVAQRADKTLESTKTEETKSTPQYSYQGPKTSIGLPLSDAKQDNNSAPLAGHGQDVYAQQQTYQHGAQNFGNLTDHNQTSAYDGYHFNQYSPQYMAYMNNPQYMYDYRQSGPPYYHQPYEYEQFHPSDFSQYPQDRDYN